MRVTTSQYEISGKNHICSVKTFSSRAESTRQRKKNSLEQAALWHACMHACLGNMHAASALFHGQTSSNNNIEKTNTWMDKTADT